MYKAAAVFRELGRVPPTEWCSLVKTGTTNVLFYQVFKILEAGEPGLIHTCPYKVNGSFQICKIKLIPIFRKSSPGTSHFIRNTWSHTCLTENLNWSSEWRHLKVHRFSTCPLLLATKLRFKTTKFLNNFIKAWNFLLSFVSSLKTLIFFPLSASPSASFNFKIRFQSVNDLAFMNF